MNNCFFRPFKIKGQGRENCDQTTYVEQIEPPNFDINKNITVCHHY